MHKVKPGQKVRILTIQIAVPADTDPSMIADEMSEMLTGATSDARSNILDWQYQGCTPAQGEIVIASGDPEEGEIFYESPLRQQHPESFAVTAFGTSPLLVQLQRLNVVLTSSQVAMLSLNLMDTLEKCGQHGELPNRVILTLNGSYAEIDIQQALDAGIAVRAI
jgi:hypothetical protein